VVYLYFDRLGRRARQVAVRRSVAPEPAPVD